MYKKNLNDISNHLYLEFTTTEKNVVTIKLNLEKEFQNDQLFFKGYEKQEDSMNDSTSSTSKIPMAILKNFVCDSNMCILSQENQTLTYDIWEEIFTIEEKKEDQNLTYEYIVNQNLLKFQSKKNGQILKEFTYQWPILACDIGTCANVSNEIKNFEENFKNRYLK